MRIAAELRAKVEELDRRYRSSWDVRSIAHVVGISPTTVAKILRHARGPRPTRFKEPHVRRTRFLKPDVMWSSDFMRLPGGGLLLKTIDEMSRFKLAWDITRSESAEAVVAQAESLVKRMGRAPLVWKFDHGSAFTSKAFQEFLERNQIVGYPIPPRAPWANGKIERDHKELRNWLIPVERLNLPAEDLEKEIDAGMLMLNFEKPRAMLGFNTSAACYFNSVQLDLRDRTQFWHTLKQTEQEIRERTKRAAVRKSLASSGLYQEWETEERRTEDVDRLAANFVRL